jgi:hypothetical protein
MIIRIKINKVKTNTCDNAERIPHPKVGDSFERTHPPPKAGVFVLFTE